MEGMVLGTRNLYYWGTWTPWARVLTSGGHGGWGGGRLGGVATMVAMLLWAICSVKLGKLAHLLRDFYGKISEKHLWRIVLTDEVAGPPFSYLVEGSSFRFSPCGRE